MQRTQTTDRAASVGDAGWAAQAKVARTCMLYTSTPSCTTPTPTQPLRRSTYLHTSPQSTHHPPRQVIPHAWPVRCRTRCAHGCHEESAQKYTITCQIFNGILNNNRCPGGVIQQHIPTLRHPLSPLLCAPHLTDSLLSWLCGSHVVDHANGCGDTCRLGAYPQPNCLALSHAPRRLAPPASRLAESGMRTGKRGPKLKTIS